ncbi:MAG: substrate-binding domain-containing protein, partial [Anaerolineae bacterium]|nr:substrate-binding domain-containing protein [Anaerolineae bacterium]
TIRQPLNQMGREAARLLLEYLGNSALENRQVTLATQLLVRDSCSSPNQSA